MFAKITIAIVLLTISRSEVVQSASFSDEFTANVAKSVKNLLGVNCMVEAVLNLEDTADEFSYQIKQKCHQSDKLSKELADTKDLMKLTTKVIEINDKICNNAGYNEEMDADTEPTSKCTQNLKSQMAKLLTSFTTTRKDVNSGLQASYSSGACVKMAMKNFKYFLVTFGSRIATCADLAAQV